MDSQQVIDTIKKLGGKAASADIMSELGWDKERFDAAKEALRGQNEIVVTRGRYGGIALPEYAARPSAAPKAVASGTAPKASSSGLMEDLLSVPGPGKTVDVENLGLTMPIRINGGWAVGFDRLQFIIYRLNSAKSEAWAGRFFPSGRPTIERFIRENKLDVLPEAREQLEKLPEKFSTFIQAVNASDAPEIDVEPEDEPEEDSAPRPGM